MKQNLLFLFSSRKKDDAFDAFEKFKKKYRERSDSWNVQD